MTLSWSGSAGLLSCPFAHTDNILFLSDQRSTTRRPLVVMKLSSPRLMLNEKEKAQSSDRAFSFGSFL